MSTVRISCCLAFALFATVIGTSAALADKIYLSTVNSATLGGLSFVDEDIVEYDVSTDTATMYFDGSTVFSANETLDAVHVLSDGKILLSTTGGATIGSLSFDGDDVVQYNPSTGTATIILDGSAVFSGNENINGVHLKSDGKILLTTKNDATIGSLSFQNEDIVEYDPSSGTATMYFDGSTAFTGNEQVDALYLMGNGNLMISTFGNAQIGALSIDKDDIIEYNPVRGTATLYFDGGSSFANTNENISGLTVVPVPGARAHWMFDETSGTTAADSSGYGNDGSILGSYQWLTKCDGDGYLDLQGATTYVNVPTDTSLNFSGDASFAGWFRLNSPFDDTSASSQVVLEKYSSTTANLHVVLVGQDYTESAPSDGSLVFKIEGFSGAYRYSWTNQTSWEAGRWYHFAVTMDATTPANTRVYIDGVDDTASTSGTTAYNDMNYAADFNIGGRTAEELSGDRYLDGQMNDFRIYNYQLSATEIAELYGLVAHWKFDETSGSTATDSSPNNFDATLSGGVTWATGLVDGCVSFDGTDGQVVNSSIGTVLNGADAVTVALWVKSNVTNVDRDIFDSNASPSGSDNSLELRYDKDGVTAGGTSLITGAVDTTAGPTSFESSSNVQTTAWQHLALVWYSGSDPVLYINGQPNSLADYGDVLGGTVDGIDRFILGVGTTSAHWDGLVDDVRVYSRALCQDEIDDLAQGAPSQGVRIIRWVEAR